MKKPVHTSLGQKAQKCFKRRFGWGIGCPRIPFFPSLCPTVTLPRNPDVPWESWKSFPPPPHFSKDGSFTGNTKNTFYCVLYIVSNSYLILGLTFFLEWKLWKNSGYDCYIHNTDKNLELHNKFWKLPYFKKLLA